MKRFIINFLSGIAGGALVLAVYLWIDQEPAAAEVVKGPKAHFASGSWRPAGAPADAPFDFSKAAEIAMPAVVHISASESRDLARQRRQREYRNDPFRFFFNDDFFFNFPYDLPPQKGTGSGVIYSADGYIVTNNHVVDFADVVQVTLQDDRTFEAAVIGVDPRTDLAVLKIEASGLPTLEFADSENARVGEWVLAVGNPFDLTSTVTAGIISAKGRDIDVIKRTDAIENFIQTDAAVNPGNSGGALVDIEGRLLGINTAIATPTGAFAGYSFAIPANMVQGIVRNIIDFGGPRAALGLSVMDVDEELANEKGLFVDQGVYVLELEDGGAAQYAGLLPKDVIVQVDGNELSSAEELKVLLEDKKVGDDVQLTINRKGKTKTLIVRLKSEKSTR